MINKTVAATKAASIKTTLDELESAVAALPESSEKDAVAYQVQRLHAKLNGAAHKLADFFDEDVSTFSGGTDKPEED
jgi:hypothetical protein